MPPPQMDWQPRGRGWDERLRRGRMGFTPGAPAWPPTTEPGGGMVSRGVNGMNGMDDFFTYPEAQGVGPGQFFDQAIQQGTQPAPPPGAGPFVEGPFSIQPEVYDETPLFGGPSQPGSMPWESGPAPWEQAALPVGEPPALIPSAAPAAIEQLQAQQPPFSPEHKAFEAVQAAKVAADNAARAARAGAPRVAATHAATAQAAANVAAGVAHTPRAQQAATIAANEANRATAAANIAAKSAGMNDWTELSGMGATTFTGFVQKYKWWLVGGGAAALAGAWWSKGRYWGK